MIVKLTAQDKKKIEKIEADFTRRISEIDALIETLRPGDEGPKGPTGALAGTPEAEEMNRNYKEWLDSGSQEWRDARAEKMRLILAKSEAFNSYYKEVELREFSKLGGDREKIIQSARDQVSLLIDNRYNYYKTRLETGIDDNGELLSGFSARDLRVEKRQIFLDSSVIASDCKTDLLSLHYEALRDDPEATKLIDEIIFEIVADSPYTSSDKGTLGAMIKVRKKRKPRSKKKLPSYSENQGFFAFSTTPAQDVFTSLLMSEGDVKETAKNINAVSKRKQAQVFIGEKSRAIKVETDHAETVIEILGSETQVFNSYPAMMIMYYIESEAYKTLYYKGKLNDDLVEFPLQKLVDDKLYSSLQNARRAFNDASNALTAIRMSAFFKEGKKIYSFDDSNGGRIVLFPSMYIENGQCKIRFNKDIDWRPLLKDFFLMPESWWGLPKNATMLEYKLFRQIRINKHNVKNGKLTFNVSLQTVATWLNLPLNTKNPKRNVKEPIETAVSQIINSLDEKRFKIEIKTDLNAPISQYLSGYLKITVSGVYVQNLTDLNDTQQKRIETATRKKEKIIEEASIRKLAEQMKEDEKNAEQNEL